MTRFSDIEIQTLRKIIHAIQLHSAQGRSNIRTSFTLIYDYGESVILESIRAKLAHRPVELLDLDTWETFQDYDFSE
jgi:hypothetical protein